MAKPPPERDPLEVQLKIAEDACARYQKHTQAAKLEVDEYKNVLTSTAVIIDKVLQDLSTAPQLLPSVLASIKATLNPPKEKT